MVYSNITEQAKRLGAGVFEVVAETLWPTRCAVCNKPGELLCERCAARFSFIDSASACPACGAPYGRIQCSECNDVILASSGHTHLPLDAMASVAVFDDYSKHLITTYKDGNERRLAILIADYMARYVAPTWLDAQPHITFVPATEAALRRRGFDHTASLATHLSHTFNMPADSLLERPRAIDQRTLGRRGRIANLEGRFTLKPQARLPNAVIIVDDVCTTGATLYGAADTLRAAGVQHIFGLTFARV